MSIFLAPAGELAVSPNHLGVIGSARGGLLDTDALYDALVSGQIAGATVDVTEPEPLENDALKNDVRLHRQERCIVRKEVMPRPPRIHVDGSLYHAEKTKNKNEKRVKSFVVKSLRGNKRKRITKDPYVRMFSK